MRKIEDENPVEEPWEPDDDYKHRAKRVSNKTHCSQTDPDARLARKSEEGANLCYSANYLMDNRNRIILGVEAERPDRAAEARAAMEMIKGVRWRFKVRPETLGADKGYATGEFIYQVLKEGITPHIPIMDTRSQRDKGIYPITRFEFDPKHNEYICPQGNRLKYCGIHRRSRQFVWPVCRAYGTGRRARGQTRTSFYRISQSKRKQIEELFGEAKEHMGLRVAKFRRLWNVKEQFLLTALAQNVKRMAKLLHKGDKIAKGQALSQDVFGDHTNKRFRLQLYLLRLFLTLLRLNYMKCRLYELAL